MVCSRQFVDISSVRKTLTLDEKLNIEQLISKIVHLWSI